MKTATFSKFVFDYHGPRLHSALLRLQTIEDLKGKGMAEAAIARQWGLSQSAINAAVRNYRPRMERAQAFYRKLYGCEPGRLVEEQPPFIGGEI